MSAYINYNEYNLFHTITLQGGAGIKSFKKISVTSLHIEILFYICSIKQQLKKNKMVSISSPNKMSYTSKDYAFIQHALITNNFRHRETRFIDGKIYIECCSDSIMLKICRLIEQAGVNPNHVNFCMGYPFK